MPIPALLPSANKSKVAILSVISGQMSVSEVCTRYGVHRSWVYKLLKRYEQLGIAGLEPADKAPLSHGKAVPREVRAGIIRLRHDLYSDGLDNGAKTIAYHLEQEGLYVPALSTIWRILHREGLVVAQPKKKPKAYMQRFVASQPNETWQSDFTHLWLADGSGVEVLNWLDDHSRLLLYCKAWPVVKGHHVVDSFKECINHYEMPLSTLTDNGVVYTARFVGGRNAFEYLLQQLRIQQKNGHPGHPQTQGKIERFHQTLKKWIAQQDQATSIEELQGQLDRFQAIYNDERPHTALGMQTPAKAYAATVRAQHMGYDSPGHYRVRFDYVDRFGKVTLRRAGIMHHLGIGIEHRGRKLMMLVDEAEVRVIDDVTGEMISTHVIEPEKNYWARTS
jgi:transposase InsO family protein